MAPKVDLSTTIGGGGKEGDGVFMPSCVYNASGPRTGASLAMSRIASSAAGGVLAKSATIVAQKGNPLPRTWHGDDEAANLNSEGLPNAGIDYYIDTKNIADSMGANPNKKPYMVSVSGHNVADNLTMIRRIADAIEKEGANISAVELNLACPNVIGKPIIGYDFDQMDDVLEEVCALPCFSPSAKNRLVLGVKMPPYFDGPHFERAASALNKRAGIVGYAACINTVGNALAIDVDAEMPSIRSKGGYAGLSGPAIKHTALANVARMRELLDPTIDVVGAGGVTTGTDAFEMILCGAAAVQVGTCHWTEGPSCFDRICGELKALMAKKGYSSVEDFRGKLKPWSKEGAALSRKVRAETKKKNGGSGGGALVKGRGADAQATQTIVFGTAMSIFVGLVAMFLFVKFGIVSV